MSSSNDQELLPEQTEGYKVGEKKDLDEYHKMGTWTPLEYSYVHYACYTLSVCLLKSDQCSKWGISG